MPNGFLAIIFALIIGIASYWGSRIRLQKVRYRSKIYSFSAGVSITYLILELFPIFTEQALWIHRLLFLSILFGFIIYHLIEKETYLHHEKRGLVKLLTLEENIFTFFYHVILGVILVTFTQERTLQGILFFIPILSFTLAHALPTEPQRSKLKAVIISSATFLGVILTFPFAPINHTLQSILIGIVVGVLLFTVTRHHIPFGRHGKPSYFMLGFIVYSLLLIGSWYV